MLSSFFGWTAWIFSCLFWAGMLLFNSSRPNLGGDNAMGYGLGLLFFTLGFGVSLLCLTGALHAQGRWDEALPLDGVLRAAILYGGALCISVVFGFTSGMKWDEPVDSLQLLSWFARRGGAIWIPLLVLASSLILLYTPWRTATPVWVWKAPMALAAGISALLVLTLLAYFMKEEAIRQQQTLEAMRQRDERLHAQHLEQIAMLQDSQSILLILSLSGRYHDPEVRNAAVSRIRERPLWEEELLELLSDPTYFSHVYTFIDGNALVHPERFEEPLRQSMRMMADQIRQAIQDANNLQDWHFDHYGIERLLRALDEQFPGRAKDFVPEVEALGQALRTPPPEYLPKVRFTCLRSVDAWLRTHRGSKK